ncbi:transposase [Streptosporangium roseum]|uniref:transposase n=1 Tax=Streptosporangium roseum TaxID=2001 RepID=UPI003D9DC47D
MNGILWQVRTRAPWRDVPDRYGPWKTLHERLRRRYLAAPAPFGARSGLREGVYRTDRFRWQVHPEHLYGTP